MPYIFGSYTSAYAGSREFRRMISSLSDKVDVAIVHIGRYLGFDEDHDYGADSAKLLHIAYEYGCHAIVSPPSTELEKRQQTGFLAGQQNIDFLLIIDTDEYIDQHATHWDKFTQACIDIAINKWHEKYNIFGIMVEDGPQTFRALPRLWFKPQYIYYDRTHYGVKTSDPNCPFTNTAIKAGEIEKHPIIETIPHLTIRSDKGYRDDKSRGKADDYRKVLNNNDNQGLLT